LFLFQAVTAAAFAELSFLENCNALRKVCRFIVKTLCKYAGHCAEIDSIVRESDTKCLEVINMAGGKLWTNEENKILTDMIAEGFLFEEILKSEKFPDRTADAIRVQIQRLVSASMVEKIEPAKDPLTLEKVIKLFSMAFGQLCASRSVDKTTLERFRIIFRAAKDYGPLLAHFEKWEKVEKRIEELAAAVAELQAAKGAKKA
jgi:hypothetical protein